MDSERIVLDAALGLALSKLPSRWARPWIPRAIHAALIAQGGCLAVSVFFAVVVGGMLVEERDIVAALLKPKPTLNADSIAVPEPDAD